MSGLINSAGSKSGVISTTGEIQYSGIDMLDFSSATAVNTSSWMHDQLLMWMYNAIIVAAIDSMGTGSASGASIGFSASCGFGALFEAAQQSTPPSNYAVLPGFNTQQYLNIFKDYSDVQYNWSTSPAGSSSWSTTVWKRSNATIRYPGL